MLSDERMRRGTLMIRAVTASLVCALMLVAPSSASAKWTRFSSAHFVFIGDASERSMRSIAQRLEQFRDVAGRVLSDGVVASPAPTIVIAFENDKSFTPFKPVFQGRTVSAAGYFVGMEDLNYIAVNAEQDSDAFGLIFHEYAHFLTANAYGPTPAWVSEGLAEFYQTLDITGETSATLGNPSLQNLQLLRATTSLLSVAELIAVEHDSPLYNENDRRGLFYAESWALAHYLTLGSPARQGQLQKYLSAMRSGTSAAAAFQGAFGDTKTLDLELRQYVRGSVFNVLKVEFNDRLVRVSTSAPENLSDADASGYRGDLLARTRRVDEARDYLRKAVNADPGAARAMAALGLLELRSGNESVALPLLERASTLAPDAATLAAYGRVLARQADRGTAEEDVLYEKARTALTRALELQPDLTPAMVSLAEVEMGRGVDTARAVSLMQAAIAASPGREEYRLMLAQAHAVNRDYQSATAVLSLLVARSSREDIRDAARQALGRVAVARRAAVSLAATVSADNVDATSGSAATGDVNAGAPAAARASSATAGGTASQTDAAARPTMPQGVYVPALRRPGAGDVRVQGTFAAIECRPGLIVLQLDTPSGPVRMAAASFKDLELVAHRDDAPRGAGCGPQRPALPAVATFRVSDAPIAGAGTPNRAVALELVPDGFELR